jgi:hypothetical protein
MTVTMASMDLVATAHPAPLLPIEPEHAAEMMAAYRLLCESILTPDDVIGIPGQQGGFVKRSGFSKLATFYGVSTEIRYQDVDRSFEGDDKGQPLRARARVRATASNGRYADGDGACAMTEPRFQRVSGRQKAEHDLMATAVTRATNRAISNLIGFGQVSAEETEGEQPAAAERPYGDAATESHITGLLRAFDDLGIQSANVGETVIDRAGGYLPRIAAMAMLFMAAAIRDRDRPPEEPVAGEVVDADVDEPAQDEGQEAEPAAVDDDG